MTHTGEAKFLISLHNLFNRVIKFNVNDCSGAIQNKMAADTRANAFCSAKRTLEIVLKYGKMDIQKRSENVRNLWANIVSTNSIDLKEFGADNFFDAVGLEEIVLGKKNLLDMKSNFPSEIIKKIAC
jgi:ribosomal protein L20